MPGPVSRTASSTWPSRRRAESISSDAAPRHGVEGVQDQVEQQLLELVPVRLHLDRGRRAG